MKNLNRLIQEHATTVPPGTPRGRLTESPEIRSLLSDFQKVIDRWHELPGELWKISGGIKKEVKKITGKEPYLSFDDNIQAVDPEVDQGLDLPDLSDFYSLLRGA